MILLPLLLLSAAGSAALFDTPKEPDAILAAERGGLRLPNGLDIALAVQTQTSVNGAVVLRTDFHVDQGSPTLSVYTPRPGQVVVSGPTTAASAGVGGAAAPMISFDGGNGLRVTPGSVAVPVSVGTGSAPQDASPVPPGLVPFTASGPVATDAGLVSQNTQGGVQTVQLNGPDLTITHLAGNAFGSAIANSGSDRAIDTQTVVSIDIRNASPDVLGSAMLRVEDVAIAATAMRVQ